MKVLFAVFTSLVILVSVSEVDGKSDSKSGRRAGGAITARAAPRAPSKKVNRKINREQAVDIAMNRARSDEHGNFKTPFIDKVTHLKNGNWLVKLTSFEADRGNLGAMYMNVLINRTGKILKVDIGGGS